MTLFNKIKFVFGISLVFILVLSTNLIDRQNFIIVEDSIQRIYDDRLVAQDILFDLAKATWEKERGYFNWQNAKHANDDINERISELLDRFVSTKLTPKEKMTFERLQKQFASLQEREQQVLSEADGYKMISPDLNAIRTTLADLSEIQLVEGGRQLLISKKAVNSANLFTQLEIGMLIFMAIIIQAMILYTPKTKEDN